MTRMTHGLGCRGQEAATPSGQGLGGKLLQELLAGEEIIGFAIENAEAVIFPSNIASQKAFEKAGFRYHHAHEDGDAFYYVYESQ